MIQGATSGGGTPAPPVVPTPTAKPRAVKTAKKADKKEPTAKEASLKRVASAIAPPGPAGSTKTIKPDLTPIGGPDSQGRYADSSWEANKKRIAETSEELSNLIGLTGVGRVVSSVAGMAADVAQGTSPGTEHSLGRLKVKNYYDRLEQDGQVHHYYKNAALDALPLYGGSAIRLVGKAGGAIFGRALRGADDALTVERPTNLPKTAEEIEAYTEKYGVPPTEVLRQGSNVSLNPSVRPGSPPRFQRAKSAIAGAGLAAQMFTHGIGAGTITQDVLSATARGRVTRQFTGVGQAGANLSTREANPVSQAVTRAVEGAEEAAPRVRLTPEIVSPNKARFRATVAPQSSRVLSGVVSGTQERATVSAPDAAARAVAVHDRANRATVPAPATQQDVTHTQARTQTQTVATGDRVPVPGHEITAPSPTKPSPTTRFRDPSFDIFGGSGQQNVYLKRMA